MCISSCRRRREPDLESVVLGVVAPSGRLSASVYTNQLVRRRDISNMDLRADGGITYQYTTAGDITFPFGFGAGYSTFRFEPLQTHVTTTTSHMHTQHMAAAIAMAAAGHFMPAGYTPDLPSYLINVTNTGAVVSDVSVLGFVSATASVRGKDEDAPLKELFVSVHGSVRCMANVGSFRHCILSLAI